MHEEPNPRRRDGDADVIQRLVMTLLLDPESHGPWTPQELSRELGSEIMALDAVTSLHAAGLVHLCGDLVFPSRPAARCFEIAEAH
jgi:hypothetical protein